MIRGPKRDSGSEQGGHTTHRGARKDQRACGRGLPGGGLRLLSASPKGICSQGRPGPGFLHQPSERKALMVVTVACSRGHVGAGGTCVCFVWNQASGRRGGELGRHVCGGGGVVRKGRKEGPLQGWKGWQCWQPSGPGPLEGGPAARGPRVAAEGQGLTQGLLSPYSSGPGSWLQGTGHSQLQCPLRIVALWGAFSAVA